MDFRAEADGEYKWILQIRCPFSRYVWLYALKDKSAPAVCAILVKWFGDNGLCSKLYVFFFFLSVLLANLYTDAVIMGLSLRQQLLS